MDKKGFLLMLIIIIVLVVSIGFLFFTNYPDFLGITGNVILENELMTHYKFENNVEDSAGHNKGLNRGSSFSKGKVNNCLIVDGIDDYVSVPGINNQMFNDTTSFTLSAWYMPTSSKFSIPDGQQSYFFGGTEGDCGLWANNLSGSFKIGHSYLVKTKEGSFLKIGDSRTAELNNWYHIVSTYNKDSKNICLYIDGELVSCTDLSVYNGITILRGKSLFYIGGRESSYSSPAKIDEAKIWNSALSAENVKKEYESYFENEELEEAEPSEESQEVVGEVEEVSEKKQETGFWKKILEFFNKLFK